MDEEVVDKKEETGTKDLIVKNMEDVLKSLSKDRKKKKHRMKHQKDKERKKEDAEKVTTSNKENVTKQPTNVFAMMMNARKQSIGSNLNGIESPEASTSSPQQNSHKRKRKEMLQEWSDNKGGRARKDAEEAGEKFVQKELKKRATRLKNLLTNGKKTEENEEEIENNDSDDEDFEPSGKKIKIKIGKKKKKRRKISFNEEESQDGKNFVSKLSSPIKKRDSLLGYFAKVNKNDESPEASPKEIPIKNGKLKKDELKSPTSSFTPSKITPRRITRTKQTPKEPVELPAEPVQVNAPQNLDQSDSRPRRSCTLAPKSYKFESPPSDKKKKEAKKEKDDSLIILSDENSSDVTQPPSKLASIFNKKVPKPVLDPEVVKARQDFLHSGLPETIRVEKERQREIDESYEVPFFPTISHVTQLERQEMPEVDWKLSKIKLRAKNLEQNNGNCLSLRLGDFTNGQLLQEKLKLELSWCQMKDRKAHGRKLKLLFETFPTYKCFHQLHEKQKASNEAELFTEKYKPVCSDQFLINVPPVASLKRFLSAWKETKTDNYDSDFEDSSCSISSSVAGSNVILLHGPSGSGKTASVLALANEMHFNVLEINAGAKRTGKKMLQELQEATQSHQLRKDKKLKHLGRSNSNNSSQDKKISLILIEDADVIFDQDDGFISGIAQLVAISKRPVILTAIDASLPHLTSYLHQNSIQFSAPSPYAASRYLTVMCLAENYIVSDNKVRKLYEKNNSDLRKTVLQLQFYFETGGDLKQLKEKPKIVDDDEEMIEIIPVSEEDMREIEDESSKSSFNSYDDRETGAPIEYQHKYFNDFFNKKEERQQITFKGSSLDEISFESEFLSSVQMLRFETNELPDRLSFDMNGEMFGMLCDSSSSKKEGFRTAKKGPKLYENLPFIQASSRDCLLDYEPMLRDICRSEKHRLANDRKGSRFYHYLRNLNPVNFSKDYFDQFTEILL